MMSFAHPKVLWLLLLLPLLLIYYLWRGRKLQASLTLSSTSIFKVLPKTWRVYLRHLTTLLRLAALAMLIIALARPQNTNSWQKESIEGIDIMLVLDISGSMQAMDLEPNRLEAAKEMAISFVNNRPNDNIGLVTFAGESFTQCPLTTDHRVLINLIKQVKMGVVDDGTAIGMGLINAINRLREGKAKSSVMILLTDGANNMGDVTPQMAADIAKTYGLRTYTIGIGTRGEAPFPIQTGFGVRIEMMPVDIDEPSLESIASTTGGQYFRAVDNKSLKVIYDEIDQLEKSRLMTKNFKAYEEKYFLYALIAFALLLIEYICRNSLLRSNP